MVQVLILLFLICAKSSVAHAPSTTSVVPRLAAARSRLGSDITTWCHSLPRRRFATHWRRLTFRWRLGCSVYCQVFNIMFLAKAQGLQIGSPFGRAPDVVGWEGIYTQSVYISRRKPCIFLPLRHGSRRATSPCGRGFLLFSVLTFFYSVTF